MNTLPILLRTWFILIVLTIISALLGKYFNLTISPNSVFVFVIMLIVALKGQQIIDIFMELNHAPRKWRLLLMSYVVIIPSVITLIYIW